MPYCTLPDRAVIAIGGAEARGFLDALVTNDVERVTPERAIYATLLTPQGKFLFDFFIAEHDGRLLLDCEAARKDDLVKRLKLYRLRSKVDIDDVSAGFAVAAAFGDDVPALGLPGAAGAAMVQAGGVIYVDPRLAAAGARAMLADVAGTFDAAGLAATTPQAYERHRVALALPAPGSDLIVDKSILLESNLAELNGVDFAKGCFVGQEVTARTKYRGLVRKRLLPVRFDGAPPAAGTPVTVDGRDAGTMGSAADGHGIALLRLERVAQAARSGSPLMAGEVHLTPAKPDWLALDIEL